MNIKEFLNAHIDRLFDSICTALMAINLSLGFNRNYHKHNTAQKPQ